MGKYSLASSFRRQRNRLTMERLEPRVLLAADLLSATDHTAPIVDPFSDQAVTVEQMIARAEDVPYVPGELMVALHTPFLADSVRNEFYLSHMKWNDLTGVSSQYTSTLMQVDQNQGGSFVLVKLDIGEADLLSTMTHVDGASFVLWSSPNFYVTGDQQDFIPDDPDYSEQYTHALVGSEAAWDFTLGDPSIIVGITDDGVDLTHPDLAPNVWTNTGEIAGNGIDDDNNGYVDDVHGWDWANDNNDPNPNGGSHGTHVAGISAARTDNGIGVAGVSGHSTIMPLQFYGGTNNWTAQIINNTFTYAADNGVNIVNTSYNINSWVGDPVFTAGMQYMYDQGVLHFNSAGNASELNPARQAFEQSLLVVSTTSSDSISSFSNYGTGMDISAPGSGIYSTLPGNSYGNNSGTSMAAPNAAGAAALIWSANPSWSRDQVAAQLLGTADNIDAQNPGYAGLLGSGRFNVENALTDRLDAPRIQSITGLPADGASTGNLTLDNVSIAFDQVMAPATANNAAHYGLRNNGPDAIFGSSDDQVFALSATKNYQIGTNQLEFDIVGGPLPFGDYELRITAGLTNPFGTELDGNSDGISGDDFVSYFTVVTPPPIGLLPQGSMIYEQTAFTSIVSPIDADLFGVELDARQSLTVIVRGDATLTPAIEIYDPAGQPAAQVSGTSSSVATQVVAIDASGTWVIEVSGEAGSVGDYEITWLINADIEQEDVDGTPNDTLNDAQDINASAVSPGTVAADRLAVIGVLPANDGIPVFQDNFETGNLGSAWTTQTTATGRIQVTGQYGTSSGNFALAMDSSTDDSNSLNEAIWTVDLAGVFSPSLVFDHISFSDEDDVLPQNYTGSSIGDGVSISDDGVNWFRIFNPAISSATNWETVIVDLSDAADDAGMTLGDNFQIKFQQYDNYGIGLDGRGYDNVSVNTPDLGADWYKFDLQDGEYATLSGTAFTSGGNVLIELFDELGNLLETGLGGQNVSSSIASFQDPTNDGLTDTWYARVTGDSTEYSLLVTRNAIFDLEPNGFASPQDINDFDGMFGFVSLASEQTVEPDSFNAGSILDNAIAGVTLSNPIGGSNVVAEFASFGAPTGDNVFSPGPGNASGWTEGFDELRADFDEPTSFVSIDVGSDDSSDVGYLRAFDQLGNLLEEVVSGSVSVGSSETLTITRPTDDIAYIIAAGVGSDITPLDNIVFGALGSEDAWLVSGVTGEPLRFDAFLPGEGPYWLDNGLDTPAGSDLRLELYEAFGSQALVASGIESLYYLPSQAGDYRLSVTSAGGAGEYFVQRTTTLVEPLGKKLLDGLVSAGSLSDTNTSNNSYFTIAPSPTSNPLKQKIDMILVSEYSGTVNNFGFHLEANMSGGPSGDVIQTIQLWNDADKQWELFDTRAATNEDSIVSLSASGDLSRFLRQSTGEIIAKVQWISPAFSNAPFTWDIGIDQVGWVIS